MERSKEMKRRHFIQTVGAGAGYMSLCSNTGFASVAESKKNQPTVMGAFVYPPTAKLDKVGYYSWPGSSYDAEGHQDQFCQIIGEYGRELGVEILLKEKPLDENDQVDIFIQEVKDQQPDALLLIPFKKSHWTHIVRIIEKTKIPTIVYVSLGVLLMPHIRQLHEKEGVYLVSSLENLETVKYGLKMVRTLHRMKKGLILNIDERLGAEYHVAKLGTRVKTISNQPFVDACNRLAGTAKVKERANRYLSESVRRVEPSEKDVFDAATTYFALKELVEQEKADAIMMNCLPGLKHPHQHVPPCMGFMELRNEGIPAGCESDIDATLTMLLVENLFEKPSFQHNPAADTQRNLYFCAHCTSANQMGGRKTKYEPYILRSHAEAGWGCVPQVLFKRNQDVTITKYLSREDPAQLLLYSGTLKECPENPPAGGCRTNAITTLNELDDVCNLKGHHLCMVYGNHSQDLKAFCHFAGIQETI